MVYLEGDHLYKVKTELDQISLLFLSNRTWLYWASSHLFSIIQVLHKPVFCWSPQSIFIVSSLISCDWPYQKLCLDLKKKSCGFMFIVLCTENSLCKVQQSIFDSFSLAKTKLSHNTFLGTNQLCCYFVHLDLAL